MAHWNAFYKELTEKYGSGQEGRPRRPQPRRALLLQLGRGQSGQGRLHLWRCSGVRLQELAGRQREGEREPPRLAVGSLKRTASRTTPRPWPTAKNPVDNLAPLAKARVPLLHVYGDADDVVPWEENTGMVAERYRKLGGEITLIAKPGVGHHPHGLDDSTPIVEFIASHTEVAEVERLAGRFTKSRILLLRSQGNCNWE